MGKTKKKPLSVIFKISDIKVLNFFIDNNPNIAKLPPDHEFTFEVKSEVQFNKDEKKIATSVTINIYLEKEKKIIVSRLSVLMIFEIQDYDKIVKHKTNKADAPIEVIKMFLSNHITMMRGILYEKTQGTALQKVYLPPININNLVIPIRKAS